MENRRKTDRRAGARRKLPGKMWLFAMIIMATAAFAIIGLLHWSTSTADRLSYQRQQRLAAQVLAQSVGQIAHDQESISVWDDTILRLRQSPLDMAWLDANLGIWLHLYYGHDEAYVLDPTGRPVYAMADGVRKNPAYYSRLKASVQPLAAALRARIRKGESETLPASELSPGVSDLIVASGHPAIVSLKPIISDTGRIVQRPGTEYVHVSLRRLDGSLLEYFRTTYGIEGARFAWRDDRRPKEKAEPLRSRNGRAIGYFIWTPFAPGSAVFARLAPVLAAGFALIAMIVFALLLRVASRTRQLRESRAAAQHLAFHDPLTGLPNRALFDDRLDHALAIYRGTGEHRLALLYLDLDRFKEVNDSLGHPAGDALIREFGRRLSAIVPVTDTAARLGGDEFAIIQTEVWSLAETELLCQQVIEAASAPFPIGGTQVFVGVSIGVALAGRDGTDAAELTRKADIALYESKDQGRGRFKFFTPAMDDPVRARQEAERDLRAALDAGDQLSVVYQPQYSAITGAMTGVEALLRWEHPENGSVPPAQFVPIAEKIGLIEPLGEWVMAEACRAARDWAVDTLSINISPVQLKNPHFAYRAIGIISEAEIDPARVELEITESALIKNAALCATNLRMLRAFGIRIALDDFGTGYSSFGSLREFEVDRVKIDRSFVDKIDVAGKGSAIIQAIVDLARSTGLKTTAEGVETDEQKHFLRTIGCNELQGYFMARPMAAQEIERLIGGPEPSSSPARARPRARPRRKVAG